MRARSTSLPVVLFALLCACTRGGPSAFELDLARITPAPLQVGPPRAKRPSKLSPGQWVKQHEVDADGRHALVTTKVLGLFGRQVWLEREVEDQHGRRASKLLLSLGDRRDARTIEVYRYWQRHPDGKVEQTPAMLLGSLKPRLQRALAPLLLILAPEAQEDVVVAAGHFRRAFRTRVTRRGLAGDTVAQTWWHSEVPFNGTLRMRSSAGHSELVAYGLSGAKSSF